jgi:hypothetical protein
MREIDIATIDHDAILDWRFSWADWLTDGDTITTATITDAGDTVEPSITVGATTHDDTSVTVWLSGGVAGQLARITCRITTSQGRTDERTLRLYVTDR